LPFVLLSLLSLPALRAQEHAAKTAVASPAWSGTWQGVVQLPGRGERSYTLWLQSDGEAEKVMGTLHTDEGNAFVTGRVAPEPGRLDLELELSTARG
jgi:hypothetical protein